MNSNGITGLVVETHNWGKSVAFWQQLGFELEESLVLRHPAGGPMVYLLEIPETESVAIRPVVDIDDAAEFVPPAAGSVNRAFEPQHWKVLEMLLGDPDGRGVSVQAPLPPGIAAPEGHG